MRVGSSCLCRLGCLAVVLLLATPVRGADAYKAEKKIYAGYLKRPSLHMRHRGRQRFAKTGDLRALQVLIKGYTRPEKPWNQVRYLIASLCADNFKQPEAVPLFATWRNKQTLPRDAWLWYRTLARDYALEGSAPLVSIVEGEGDNGRVPGILRMAALGALNEVRAPNRYQLLTRLLSEPAGKPFDFGLLMMAAADRLYLGRAKRTLAVWQKLAGCLIPCLDRDYVTDATRLVVVRRLARCFGTKTLYLNSAPWLALLAGKQQGADTTAGGTPVGRFLGMRATGKRVCYVIDLSDSMLDPLTAREVTDLSDFAALPWDEITSRLDAVRELLRLSLPTLGLDQSFCVVTFGSEARLLKATPGLRRATPAAISKVMRELDAIKPGPPKRGRPHGTLGGYTNLHGGLHRAFEVKGRGLVKQDEYVDPEMFEQGCDSIFLLSDGKPTWDDYPMEDTLEKQDTPGDPETGYTGKDNRTAIFYGPYTFTSWLRDDLARMNMFRRVEIHCVGLGSYDGHLFSWLSRLGLGELRRIGDPPRKGKKSKGKAAGGD